MELVDKHRNSVHGQTFSIEREHFHARKFDKFVFVCCQKSFQFLQVTLIKPLLEGRYTCDAHVSGMVHVY